MTRRYWIIYILAFTTLACGISAPLAVVANTDTAPTVIIVTSTPTVTHYCFGIVTAGRLNLRAAPDYRSSADGAGLVKWQVITLLDSIGDWYYVETSDGRRGYAHVRYIGLSGTCWNFIHTGIA